MPGNNIRFLWKSVLLCWCCHQFLQLDFRALIHFFFFFSHFPISSISKHSTIFLCCDYDQVKQYFGFSPFPIFSEIWWCSLYHLPKIFAIQVLLILSIHSAILCWSIYCAAARDDFFSVMHSIFLLLFTCSRTSFENRIFQKLIFFGHRIYTYL